MNHSRKSGLGFTLIEVLVALTVLSIGLLGVAALLFKAEKSDASANMGAQAVVLASSMLDSIRANWGTTTSSTNSNFSATQYNVGLCATPNSPNTIAQTDLSNWKTRIVTNLPGGTTNACGSVNIQTTNGVSIATIQVQWSDTRAASLVGGADKPIVTVTSVVP